jgi:hypothetical protein
MSNLGEARLKRDLTAVPFPSLRYWLRSGQGIAQTGQLFPQVLTTGNATGVVITAAW